MTGNAVKCNQCGKIEFKERIGDDSDNEMPEGWWTLRLGNYKPDHACSIDCCRQRLSAIEQVRK